MAWFPRSKSDGLVAIEAANELIIQFTDGREAAQLDKVTSQVWKLADGSTPVGQIARLLTTQFDIPADEETVWSALDRLADLDLIDGRLTPPAAVNLTTRRGVMRAVASASFAAGALGAGVLPAAAVNFEGLGKSAGESLKYTSAQYEHDSKATNPISEGISKSGETGIKSSSSPYESIGKIGRSGQPSDIRLKRDVAEVGRCSAGLKLYRYRYVWDDQFYVGVMAQEVQEVMPSAVTCGKDGYLRVDYDQLGRRLMTLQEWERETLH